MKRIEDAARKDGQYLSPVHDSAAIILMPEKEYGYLTLLRLILHTYPRRAILGGTLMITQSFLYNAIFFTYALVLTKFYHVTNDAVPLYGLAFAVGNLAGPLLLGHLFDSLGRRKMISGTYLISGAVLAFSAWLFDTGVLNAAGQTFIWIVIFFFASAGASAGYLTVSEIFPIEIRAEAIAVFFAIAQVFGAIGPLLYGVLIGNGSNRTGLTIGYRDTTLIAVMAYAAERGWSPAVKPGATSLTPADDRAVAEELLREAIIDALSDAAE